MTDERERRASNQEINTVSQKRNQSTWFIREGNKIPGTIEIFKHISSLERFYKVLVFHSRNTTDRGLMFHQNKLYLLGGYTTGSGMCTNLVSGSNLNCQSVTYHIFSI